MPSSKVTYDLTSGAPSHFVKEEHIEYGFVGKLQNLMYEYREDIRDRAEQRPHVELEGATEQVEAPVEASVEAPVTLTETDKRILRALAAQPLGRHALLTTLGYSQPTGNYKAAMTKLLRAGLIEPTIPDKPNSRSQQYRVTAQGKALLK